MKSACLCRMLRFGISAVGEEPPSRSSCNIGHQHGLNVKDGDGANSRPEASLKKEWLVRSVNARMDWNMQSRPSHVV